MKKTSRPTATRKLYLQAEHLVNQLHFLASAAEAASSMTEWELEGMALSLFHALDDAEALANTIELMQKGPEIEIVTPFPASFVKSDSPEQDAPAHSAELSEGLIMRQKIHATCHKILSENHKNNGHSAGKMSPSDVA